MLWASTLYRLMCPRRADGCSPNFVGPDVRFTWGTSLGANLAVDLPVVQNNSALQIVPNFRLRGGAT